MKKRTLLVTAGLTAILALGLATLGNARPVYAQDATPTPPTTPWGERMMGGQHGAHHGAGIMRGNRGENRAAGGGLMHPYMTESFAQALGVSVADLQTQLDAGKTMWQIATEKGLSEEEIKAVMVSARSNALNAMVADGTLTQEQANQRLQRMDRVKAGGLGAGNCTGSGFQGGRGGRR